MKILKKVFLFTLFLVALGACEKVIAQSDLLSSQDGDISTSEEGIVSMRSNASGTTESDLWNDIVMYTTLEISSSERNDVPSIQEKYGQLIRDRVRIVEDANGSVMGIIMPLQQKMGSVNNLFVAQIYKEESQFYIWQTDSDQSELFANRNGTDGTPEVWGIKHHSEFEGSGGSRPCVNLDKTNCPNDIPTKKCRHQICPPKGGGGGEDSTAGGTIIVITNGRGSGWASGGDSTGSGLNFSVGYGGGTESSGGPIVVVPPSRQRELITKFIEKHELKGSVWGMLRHMDQDCMRYSLGAK